MSRALDLMTRALEGHAGPVGIAVSGGSDSLAALVLACDALGPSRVRAASVDHGLRPEAADEARAVARICAEMGVEHTVLRVEGRLQGNLQNEARAARYELLSVWAQKQGLSAVVLGHTRDDQAETVLLRLARGSGVDGLSGMRPVVVRHGVRWLRPLLETAREELRVELRARGLGWVEDPSNEDPRFARVRARQILAALEPLGLRAEDLANTATRMARARDVLEDLTCQAWQEHVCEATPGVAHVTPEAFELPGEIRDRLFADLIRAITGAVYRPRHSELQRWIEARGGTLAGCVLDSTADKVVLYREAAAVADLHSDISQVWDRGWQATAPGDFRLEKDVQIRAVGEAGLAQLSQQAKAGMHDHWRETGAPQAALKALPGLWQQARLIAAPLHGWPNGWRIDARPLAAFVIKSA